MKHKNPCCSPLSNQFSFLQNHRLDITTNIIIAIIITTLTIIRTELNCMEQDDKQLLAGLREEFLQAPSYEVLLFYSYSDLRIFIFLIPYCLVKLFK